MNQNLKPLGVKAYGSIAHLPMSRMGVGDHHCHEGQAVICTEKARDKHDRVIVTEKLDGSCVAVAKTGGEIVALGRAGYLAETSPYPQHKVFAWWVRQNAERFAAVPEGQRIVGEWLYQAHGTMYRAEGEPFVPFDVIAGQKRLPHDEARALMAATSLKGAQVIHDGGPLSIAGALVLLGDRGFHGAEETIEGAVWRVEHKGSFDFLAKFVRPEKQDGKYLANLTSNDAMEDTFLWPLDYPGEAA